jgi:subtilisin family serine protease
MSAFLPFIIFAATAYSTSTHCATKDLKIDDSIVDKQLIGCGPAYPENLLWNLDRADAVMDGTAKRRTTGKGSIIYLVDTGVEQSHDEFQRPGGMTNIIGGLDPFKEVTGASSCSGESATHVCPFWSGNAVLAMTHGTATASVAAGRTVGVAPDASIVSVRVIGIYPPSNLAIWQRALDDIVKHAFDAATPPFRTAIVSMSSTPGITDPRQAGYPELEQKIRLMIGGVDKDFNADPNGKKFLFLVFAGNNASAYGTGATGQGQCTVGNGVSTYPALAGPNIDGLITVGGIDQQNYFWGGSCSGAAIEILAPAQYILSASITGHDHYRGSFYSNNLLYDYTSGTSYATPYVAGIAARMLEAEPTITPVDLEQRIKASPSSVSDFLAPAGGHVAVLIEAPPPPVPPRRRAVRH